MTATKGMNLALFFLLVQAVGSFLLPSKSLVRLGNNPSSTKINLFDLFNEGKKALVKKLAGDYDSEAIRARIDGLINQNEVLMLSFRT
mmetsp:Transcript_22202/g.33673  ORF Transcript_22202/g.33673 Transcript_22202/m.33673 type:complete len:88 (+) Transcript_22202:103-366(+)